MSLEHRVIGLLEDDPIMGESLVQRLRWKGPWCAGGRPARGAGGNRARRSRRRSSATSGCPTCPARMSFARWLATRGARRSCSSPATATSIRRCSLIRAGAGDYLTKPFEMPVSCGSAVCRSPEAAGDPVLGVSEAMRALEQILLRLARVTPALLLTGETGVGKEVCARFLHSARDKPRAFHGRELRGHSRRSAGGEISVTNAGRSPARRLVISAMPSGPARARSSSTRSAISRRRSRPSCCGWSRTQFHRVGGEAAIPFRARIVCATNADLRKRVREGRFREDLFYRINVVSITVPPLRERPDDIAWLLDRFFDEFNRTIEAALAGVSGLAEEAALEHRWPGNVRELRNRVERAVALALGPWLMPGDCFPKRQRRVRVGREPVPRVARQGARPPSGGTSLRALALTGGEIIPAAKALGISRTTLWEKMRRYGLAGSTLSADVRKSEHGRAACSRIRTVGSRSRLSYRQRHQRLGLSPVRGIPLAISPSSSANLGRKRCGGVTNWSMSAGGNS